MKILLVGGAGYVGCELALDLIKKKHEVKIYDLMIYKVKLPKHKNLKIVIGDVRNIKNYQKISKKILE